MAPEFTLDISDKVKLPYVEIEATKQAIDDEVENICNRYGKMSEVDAAGAEDILFGAFQMVDKKGHAVEGVEVKEGRLGLKSISDKKVAKAAQALKKGETIEFNAAKNFIDTFQLEEVLGYTEVEKAASTGLFVLTLKTIYHLEPAVLDQELFDKLFGEGVVSSEKELREKIEADLKGMYQRDADTHFFNTVTDHLMKTKMTLPEAFMKKWITQQGEKAPSMEEVEEQWPNTEKAMRWQMIESKLSREYHLHVHKEELVAYAVDMVKGRMAQFGQEMDDKQAEQLALSVLQNREQSEQLSEQLLQDKMMKFFKESFGMKVSKMGYAEFLKLASKNQ
jgi:trigger factor